MFKAAQSSPPSKPRERASLTVGEASPTASVVGAIGRFYRLYRRTELSGRARQSATVGGIVAAMGAGEVEANGQFLKY